MILGLNRVSRGGFGPRGLRGWILGLNGHNRTNQKPMA